MTRSKASLVHLGISLAIATLVFLPVYFAWFPDVLFRSAGGRELFFTITAVDVTLGPLITLIIFKPGKPGLKFDLVVIGTIQAIALAYGVYALFEARPVYVAFSKDRFDLVRANEVPDENLRDAQGGTMRFLPLTGPRLVGTRLPTDPDEAFKVMISGFGGVDVGAYPQYHVPYQDVRPQVVKQAQPFAKLRPLNPESQGELDAIVRRHGGTEARLAFLPLRAGKRDLTVIVDARTGDFLEMVELLPWR